MNKPAVLIIPESNTEIIKEVSDLLADNNVLVKLMHDDEFNVMFNIDCDTLNVDMSDEAFLTIAKLAHEKDITFNQMVVNILRKQLKKNEVL
jgi:hypothetical protein